MTQSSDPTFAGSRDARAGEPVRPGGGAAGEEALRQREADLSLALDAARLGDWNWDLVTGEVAWSARCKALYGLPPDAEMTYERFRAAVHPDDRERVEASIRRAVETRTDYDGENRIIWPDGSVRWTATRARVYCDAAGRPLRMAGVTMDLTDRKRAEEALKRSERKLEEAQRISHVGYWEHDLGTSRVTWSDESYRIFGLPPGGSDLDVDRLRPLVHPDDLPAVSQATERALRGGPPFDVEYRVVRPDGELRFVHSRGDVIRDGAGRPRSIFGIVQDITEGKQAEEALRRSHRQYEELVASLDGIVWEADARTFRFLFVSHQAEQVLGYPREQWLGQPDFWASHVHPDDRAWAVAFCAAATRERRNHTFEYRMIAADGRVIWLRDIVSVVVGGGEPVKLRGMMVDVTDRRRAETALAQSEQRYREVFNCTSDCLFLLDVTPEGRFSFVELNPADERAIGIASAEVAGKFVEDALRADLAAEVTANFRRCIESGTIISYEEVLDVRAGPRDFHTTLIPVRDEAGRIHRIIGVARDITESKRAEERLRVSLREKEALLREVHHRVKNNLQLISSLLSLQAGRTRDPAVAEGLAESRNRLRTMALVHESLYQLGNFAGIPMASHVPNLCAQLFRSYGAPGQGIGLETRVADVVLDLDRAIPCSLIINELVTNALKHAFPGGRPGRVLVALGPGEGDRYRLEVSDDGVGLAAGLDPPRADSLGLQLVADLTEQLRGALRVSRDGGTTFIITFGTDGRGGQ